MTKYGLNVKSVCEFFPKNPALLGMNVNRGAKVYLRLRHHYDESRFLAFESIVGTMLHELTHNKHGPHDQRFYAYLDVLTLDLEKMMAQGWNGDGFYSPGHVLGTSGKSSLASGSSHLSSDLRKKQAALAAKRRHELFRNSGSRLGTLSGASTSDSTTSHASSTPRSMRDAIRAAAERRHQDSQKCKHVRGTSALSNEEYGIEIIDLTGDDDTDVSTTTAPGGTSATCKKAMPIVIDLT